MTGKRSGFALLDVLFATMVFGLGGLAAASLMIRSSRLAFQASELRRASSRIDEAADSLLWSPSVGAGRQVYPDGLVTWTSTAARVHLQGWGADTTGAPIASLWSARW